MHDETGGNQQTDNVKLTDLEIGEMEFEAMQVLWNSQTQEKLFAINESALHDTIKRKGRKIDYLLQMVEWIMIVVNLGVGVFLLIRQPAGQRRRCIDVSDAPCYLAFVCLCLYRRIVRRQDEVRLCTRP